MEPRIYVYKITFEDREEWYYGVHKEKKFDEHYMGSPAAHKNFWKQHTPHKEILEIFEYTDEGWHKALARELELIRPFLNDPLCLNEYCGGSNSLASRSATMSRLNREWWSDEVYRESMSEKTKEQWKDPEFKRKVSETISQRNKKSWQDPEYLEKNSKLSSQRMKSLWQNPEFREAKTNEFKNRITITDGTVEGTRVLKKSEEIPEGFRRGKVTGLMWITNGTKEGTHLIPRGMEIPQGYRRGMVRGLMWITDGTKEGSTMIGKDKDIPPGFRKGRVAK